MSNSFYESRRRNALRNRMKSNMKAFGIIAFTLLFAAFFIGAWVEHVIVCIRASNWILLVFGIVVPPIGLVHGIGCWLGVF